MKVKDRIMGLIEKAALLPAPVGEEDNLCTRHGFDSLSFVALLVEIEEAFSVEFDIAEMETCLVVGQLIAMTEAKLAQNK